MLEERQRQVLSTNLQVGYDPINDIDWLLSEIHDWIYGNLKKKWPNIVRRHIATNSSNAETLQAQFSGYGSNLQTVNLALDRMENKNSLDQWNDDDVHAW